MTSGPICGRAAAKRCREQEDHNVASTSYGCCHLLQLPEEVQSCVLQKLDVWSLAQLGKTCKAFRAMDKISGLRFVEKIAKAKLSAIHGPEQAELLLGGRRCEFTGIS